MSITKVSAREEEAMYEKEIALVQANIPVQMFIGIQNLLMFLEQIYSKSLYLEKQGEQLNGQLR